MPKSMSATGEIRTLCDQPGRELREALVRYSKGNARAPYSIQADSMLYGDLLRHYLQWCAGLLAKMEEAAAARPAWKDAVAQLLERTAAYFKETARWPSVSHLDHPLRLLLPACYATRAAQRVNSLFEPALVAVDFTEPNEFVTELLGQPIFEQISHDKNADFKTMAKITEDPPHEAEPLHYRSFLHAAQRARLAEARAAKPKPPEVAPPPPPPAPPPAGIRRGRYCFRSLLESEIERYAHHAGEEPILTLVTAGTPILLQGILPGPVPRTSLPPAGNRICFGRQLRRNEPVAHRETRKESEGEWKIQVRGGAATLVLTGDNGGTDYYRIEKASRDAVKLDGRDRAWAPL